MTDTDDTQPQDDKANVGRMLGRLATKLNTERAAHETHRRCLGDTLGVGAHADWAAINQRADTVQAAAAERADLLEEARDALEAAGQNGAHGDDWPAVAPAIRALAAERANLNDLVKRLGETEFREREKLTAVRAECAAIGTDRCNAVTRILAAIGDDQPGEMSCTHVCGCGHDQQDHTTSGFCNACGDSDCPNNGHYPSDCPAAVVREQTAEPERSVDVRRSCGDVGPHPAHRYSRPAYTLNSTRYGCPGVQQ